jgi:membrane protease YdiL (CAAX protease family)
MNRAVGLLVFNLFISIGVALILNIAGLILRDVGFSSVQVKDTTMLFSMAIATAITIYYGYRKGYMQRRDFSFPLSVGQANYALVLYLLILIPIAIFNEYVPLPDFFEWMDMSFTSPGFIIAAVLIAPIGEEIIFRGMITKLLLKEYRPAKAILISALIFGIIHLNPAQILGAFVAGLLFGWLYYKTRSVIPGIILHFINNGLSVLVTIYLGETWELNNHPLALALLIISAIALPLVFKRAQVAFSVEVRDGKAG